MSGGIEIVDPKLRAIVNRVVQKIELAIEKVGANQQDPNKYPLAADPKSFEQIIASHFRTLSDEKKKNAIAKIMSQINASQAIRDAKYGDLARVDLTKPESIETQSKALPFPNNLKISPEYLKSLAAVQGNLLNECCRQPRLDLVAPGWKMQAPISRRLVSWRGGSSIACVLAAGLAILALSSGVLQSQLLNRTSLIAYLQQEGVAQPPPNL